MNGITEQIRSLWIPLREVNMLLPHVAIAEVGNFRVPDEQPDTPDWLLGTIDWRGQIIPVISLELLCGDQLPANPVYSRLIIINSVRTGGRPAAVDAVRQHDRGRCPCLRFAGIAVSCFYWS
jgi:chemosensory pili system protein ChpC